MTKVYSPFNDTWWLKCIHHSTILDD